MERAEISPEAVCARGLNLLLVAGIVIAGVAFGLPALGSLVPLLGLGLREYSRPPKPGARQ